MELPLSTRRVIDELTTRGLDIEIMVSAETTRSAADAAAAIGASVAQIVKSLVFLVDGKPVLALMSGINRLDEAKLARAAGGEKVKRASADQVRTYSSFVIGGVPPISMNPEMRVFCDVELAGYAVLYAAAGTPHHNFAIAPDRLIEVARANLADLKVD